VSTQGEAIDFCARTAPDLIIVSLSLPEESAFALFRQLRTSVKTKYTPIFALVVKTDTAIQQQAQQIGFSAIITKPIDVSELETKISKAMNLDTSLRYFENSGEFILMKLPENCSPAAMAEVAQYLKPKLADGVDAGINKMVIDIKQVKALHMGIIKILMQAMQTSRELGMQFALVGNAQITAECKGFEDTRSWIFYDSLEEAKANMGKAPAPQLATA
jgi:two-component system cell cycle response regulator